MLFAKKMTAMTVASISLCGTASAHKGLEDQSVSFIHNLLHMVGGSAVFLIITFVGVACILRFCAAKIRDRSSL